MFTRAFSAFSNKTITIFFGSLLARCLMPVLSNIQQICSYPYAAIVCHHLGEKKEANHK